MAFKAAMSEDEFFSVSEFQYLSVFCPHLVFAANPTSRDSCAACLYDVAMDRGMVSGRSRDASPPDSRRDHPRCPLQRRQRKITCPSIPPCSRGGKGGSDFPKYAGLRSLPSLQRTSGG